MTDVASATYQMPALQEAEKLRHLGRYVLWLLAASGAIVFIEPSPYEVVMLIALFVLAGTGLRMSPLLLVPLFFLVFINIGYSISAIRFLDDMPVMMWVGTSWYMAVAAMLYAIAFSEDTEKRLDYLSRGYVFGALVASTVAILGYFHVIPGSEEMLVFGGRAKGTFKDPNVLGAFLVYPGLITLQRVIDAPFWPAVRNAVAFCMIALAVFLAFSRAAWAVFALGTVIVVLLMFITAPSRGRRIKIILLAMAAVVVAVLGLALLLSVSSTASLFEERASLTQSYDGGRFGRFGRHLLGSIMALDYPLGIGPIQFDKYFPEATHNSFLNAFMSGGWLSGVVYPALILATLVYGGRILFQPTPWRTTYFAVYATFFVTFLESFIIDTDHWRHYFMMIGLVWGVIVANNRYMAYTAVERPAIRQGV